MLLFAAVMRTACALVLATAAAVAVGCAPGRRPPEPVALPASTDELPPEIRFLEQIDRTRGHRDVFTVLKDPALVAAGSAPRMADDEMVLGLDLGAVQVAYPLILMNHHEIVEQDLAGLALLVCW
jgi:hypothetical protein